APELGRARVEGAEQAHDVALLETQVIAERAGGRRLHRAEAAEAAAVVARAQRAAARVGDRPEARRPVRDHHADVARALALDAHAVAADRGAARAQAGRAELQ